jgi:hypothetical protein
MTFDELWRVNVRSEPGRGDSIGTQETAVPHKADVSEHFGRENGGLESRGQRRSFLAPLARQNTRQIHLFQRGQKQIRGEDREYFFAVADVVTPEDLRRNGFAQHFRCRRGHTLAEKQQSLINQNAD